MRYSGVVVPLEMQFGCLTSLTVSQFSLIATKARHTCPPHQRLNQLRPGSILSNRPSAGWIQWAADPRDLRDLRRRSRRHPLTTSMPCCPDRAPPPPILHVPSPAWGQPLRPTHQRQLGLLHQHCRRSSGRDTTGQRARLAKSVASRSGPGRASPRASHVPQRRP